MGHDKMICNAIHIKTKGALALMSLVLALSPAAGARELRDSVEVHFRQSKANVDPAFGGNGARIDSALTAVPASANYRVAGIRVVGAASPEGTVSINRRLSEQRARGIFDYISSYTSLPDSLATFTFVGRDWEGLRRLCEADTALPARGEVLALLDNEILPGLAQGHPDNAANLARLKAVGGGKPYAYMYSRMFPALRASVLYIDYAPLRTFVMIPPSGIPALDGYTASAAPRAIILPPVQTPRKPFYMALKTNMLYDVLALPSVGAEIYAGKNISVGANWTYGWWKTDRRHRYWRAYGGDVALRRWFGSAAARKPLTGHHIGVYAGAFTYDFEWGGKGYMGGRPGGTLWDKCMVTAGVEYGYSLPVGRRLNIDFTIGIGYIGGTYVDYIPDGSDYIWQSTHRLNWFGPTKAEISLVWLIGRGNSNVGKGGFR